MFILFALSLNHEHPEHLELQNSSLDAAFQEQALVFLGCQSCIEVVDIAWDAAIEPLQTLGIAPGFSPEPSKKMSESTVDPLHSVGCFFTVDAVLGRKGPVGFPRVGGKAPNAKSSELCQQSSQGFLPTRTQLPSEDSSTGSIHSKPKPDGTFFFIPVPQFVQFTG